MAYVIREITRLLTLELIQRRLLLARTYVTRQGQAGSRITGGQASYDNA